MTEQTKSVHCVRDLRDVPASAYRLPGDGRQWLHASRQRQALAMLLATYADSDGSRVRPSRVTMAAHLSCSVRTVQSLLNDLEELGLQRKVGLHGESGPAVRQLDVDALRTRAGVQTSPARVKASPEEECKLDRSGVQSSSAGVQGSGGGVQPMRCTQPSGLPSPPPPPTATEPPTAADGWWREFNKKTSAIPAMLGATITAQQKRDLHAQSLRCGEDLFPAIREWIDKRSMPVETLRNKWGAWLNECEPFLDRVVAKRAAAAQRVKDDIAQAASIERQTAELLRQWARPANPDEGMSPEEFMAE